MIRDTNGKYLISSLGWVDKGSIWVFENQTESVRIVPLSDATYLTLHRGKQNLFSVGHHSEKDRFQITVHSATNPGEVISQVFIDGGRFSFHGDLNVWTKVPKAYVTYISHSGIKNFWLILIEQNRQDIQFQQFEWYDDSFDKGYQGIVDVAEVPDSELLLVTVQRDSNPILYDPSKQCVFRKLDLVGNHGNPKAYFLNTRSEVWMNDYDTIVKLSVPDFLVVAAKKLQESKDGMSQFIGNFTFDANERLCVVARPFSGDVIALNVDSLKTRYYCEIGSQPLDAFMLEDGRVIARDWHTGDLLTGKMKRRLFG